MCEFKDFWRKRVATHHEYIKEHFNLLISYHLAMFYVFEITYCGGLLLLQIVYNGERDQENEEKKVQRFGHATKRLQ